MRELLSLALLAGLALPVPANPAPGDGCGPDWSIVASANDTGENSLNDVAVVSEDDIWAVGNHLPAGNFRTLTEHWDGTSWSVVASPNAGSKDNSLNEVAALASNDVWAVGYSHADGSSKTTTLAEHWDGSAWTVATTPNVGTGNNALTGVAALSSNDVWAVGSYFNGDGTRQTLILHYDGTSWVQVPSPSVGTLASALTEVAAASSTDVWAIGWSVVRTEYRPLMEHWDGTRWRAVNDRRRAATIMASLSVVGASDIWAVGHRVTPTTHSPTAGHWNGSNWSLSPVRGPGTVGVLRGVAAVGATDVWAVGAYYDPGAKLYRSFTEHYDGADWQGVGTPSTTEGDELKGVAVVPQTGQVWAVGSTGEDTLIETICPGSRAQTRGSSISHTQRPPEATGVEATPPNVSEPRPRRPLNTTVFAVDDAVPAGIYRETHTWSAAVADIDEDGWPDIFIGGHLDPGFLFVNQGGTFAEIDEGTFAGKDRHDCAWGDVNVDGLLDLFCSVGAQHGLALKANDLQIQQPDQTFVERTADYALLDPFGRGRHLTFIDVNHDPYPDLFVENFAVRGDGMPSSNHLYLNRGGSEFRDAAKMGLNVTNGEACAQAVDYDRDGWEDLMFCAGFGQGVKIYRNDAGKRFIDVSGSVGLSAGGLSGAVMTDLNGDGFVDLARTSVTELEVMLQVDGVLTTVYTRNLSSGTWVAAGDADGDTRPDLYVVQEGSGGNNAEDVMLLNDGDGTSFTEVDIPQTVVGCGDAAYPIDFNGNGLTDFVVLNGCGPGDPGPIQLISFYEA